MSKTANQNNVVVTLPDGTTRRFLGGVTAGEVAADIGPGLAKAALAARIDGELVDLSSKIGSDAAINIVTLKDEAMASSGNYRKFRVDPETGEKYVHTIDPKTGYTKNSNVLASSVVAKTCAVADAFATSFMAMDLDKSKAILKEHDELEAYIIYLDEDGKTQEFFTPGFEALVKQ